MTLFPVFNALLRNTLSINWYIIASNGNKVTPSAVLWKWAENGIFIVLVDNSSNQYTTSSVNLIINGYQVLNIPVTVTKQSNYTLVIVLNISVSISDLPQQLINDIYAVFVGRLFPWSVSATYYYLQYAKITHTVVESGHTTYTTTCSTTQLATTVTHTVGLGSPTTQGSPATTEVISISISYSNCAKIRPKSFTIRDSRGNNTTISVNLSVSPFANWKQTLTTIFQLGFS